MSTETSPKRARKGRGRSKQAGPDRVQGVYHHKANGSWEIRVIWGGRLRSEYRKTEAGAERRADWWRARIHRSAGAAAAASTAAQQAREAAPDCGNPSTAAGWLQRLWQATNALTEKLADTDVSVEEAALGARALADVAKAARPYVEFLDVPGEQPGQAEPASDDLPPMSDEEIAQELVNRMGPQRIALMSGGRLRLVDAA